MQLFWIAVFGVLGVFSRYGIDQLAVRVSMPIPLNTLGINILGSLVAGVVYVFGIERSQIPFELRTGIMVGFLGGFTTFSAYSLQSAILLEKRALQAALAYFLLSPILGLIGTLAGIHLTRMISRQ